MVAAKINIESQIVYNAYRNCKIINTYMRISLYIKMPSRLRNCLEFCGTADHYVFQQNFRDQYWYTPYWHKLAQTWTITKNNNRKQNKTGEYQPFASNVSRVVILFKSHRSPLVNLKFSLYSVRRKWNWIDIKIYTFLDMSIDDELVIGEAGYKIRP